MKKILAIALAVVMAIGVLAACGGPAVDPGVTPPPVTPTPDPVTPTTPDVPDTKWWDIPHSASGTLTVGYGAPATGEFINGFGNSAYDLSIKTLLHGGMGPFIVTLEGGLDVNPTVVKEFHTEDDAEGNREYIFTIHDDLLWSDGTQITAKDFVAGVLWEASPQWVESGASSYTGAELVGYEEYNEGQTEYFAGVKLLGNLSYSLTIRAEELPFYGEYSYVSTSPIPMHSYTPGIDVVSDANGAKFTADISDQTDRIATTERYSPTIVAGPYTFVSFTNNVVTLQANMNFKGDAEGRRPSIEFVTQIEVSDETDVDQLFAGEVDYLPEEIMGAKIERVKSQPGFEAHSFLRNGYGVMNMMADWGPTADKNVRWAIACLVDRYALLDQVLEGYGGLVDTEAGEAQWMYQMKKGELQDKLIPIALSIDRANGYLDQTEWVFEADGTTPFDASLANAEGTYLRHNAEGKVLTIVHGAANAQVGAVLEIEFLKNTPLAGINYNFEYPEWGTVLDQLYYSYELPDEERYYSTFSMGTGFGVPFDPYYSWHSDFLGTWINATQFNDPELDKLMIEMRRREPDDHEGYLEVWFRYAVRWNEMMPAIPLYSNEYFDLHSSKVQNVNTNPFASWYQVICEITVAD